MPVPQLMSHCLRFARTCIHITLTLARTLALTLTRTLALALTLTLTHHRTVPVPQLMDHCLGFARACILISLTPTKTVTLILTLTLTLALALTLNLTPHTHTCRRCSTIHTQTLTPTGFKYFCYLVGLCETRLLEHPRRSQPNSKNI